MSQHIILKSWSRPDSEDVSRKLAKVFRMSPKRSSTIMDELAKGTSWQFEYTISDEQAPTAQVFLEQLGFSVEIISALSLSSTLSREGSTSENQEPKPIAREETLALLSSREEEKSPSLSVKFVKGFGKRKLTESTSKETTISENKLSLIRWLSFLKKKDGEGSSLSPSGYPDRKFWFSWKDKKPAPVEKQFAEPYRKGFTAKEAAGEKTQAKSFSGTVLFLVILLLTGGSIVGLSYLVGMKIETRFNKLPMVFSSNGKVQWINKRFDRGWFYSTADTVLKVQDIPLKFQMSHDISHGPLMIHDLVQPHPHEHLNRLLTKGVKKYLARAFLRSQVKLNYLSSENFSPIQMQTRINFDGSFQINFFMNPFSGTGGNGLSFRSSGLKGQANTLQDLSSISGQLQTPSLVISQEKNQTSFNGFKAIVNMKRRPSGEYYGSFQFTIDHLVVNSLANPVTFSSVNLMLVTREKNTQGQFTSQLHIGELKIADNVFGPGTLNVQTRNLGAIALLNFKEFINLKDSADPKEQEKQLNVLNDIAKRSPELEITQFQFTAPEGMLEGRAKFGIDGAKIDLVRNFFSIFSAIHGNLSLSMPKIYFEREYVLRNSANPPTPPMRVQLRIKDFLRYGYLTSKENNYTTYLDYHDGQLIVNGKLFSPSK